MTPLVVFDLDGVLIHSAPGIRHSLDHALTSAGMDAATDSEAFDLLGPPLHAGLTTLIQRRSHSLDVVDGLVATFRTEYATASLRLTTLYPGAIELLQSLGSDGYRTALATSKARPATEALLAALGLDVLLDPVGCPVDVVADTKSDILGRVLAQADVAATDAVMVGDRSHDMIAARALGTWAIGAQWGYGSYDELIEAGAHVVANSPAHVAQLIAERR